MEQSKLDKAINPVKTDKKEESDSTSKKMLSSRLFAIDAVFFLVFSALFLLISFNHFNIYLENSVSNSVYSDLKFPIKSTNTLLTQLDLMDRITSISSALINPEVKIGDRILLASSVRYTYRFVKFSKSKTIIPNFVNIHDWETSSISPFDSFNADSEDNSERSLPFDQEKSFYSKGGYVLIQSKDDLASTEENASEKVNSNSALVFNIVTKQTATIVFDMIGIDYETSVLIPIRAFITINSSGILHEKLEINSIPLYRYEESAPPILYAEMIFFAVLIAYTVYFIYYKIKENKVHYLKNKEKNAKKSSFSLILGLIFQFENIIVITSFAISFVSSVFWVVYLIKLKSLDLISKEEFIAGKRLDLSTMNSVHELGYFLDSYKIVVSLNSLFLFLRLVNTCSTIFPRTKVFFSTISLAKDDLVGFFVFFLVICFSATTFTYFFYGNEVSHFSEYFDCLNLNLQFLIGFVGADITRDMRNYSLFVSTMYFFVLIVFVKYIVLKMILAILLYYFKIASDTYDTELILRKSGKFSRKHIQQNYENYFFKAVTFYSSFVTMNFSSLYKKYFSSSKGENAQKTGFESINQPKQIIEKKPTSRIMKFTRKKEKDEFPVDFSNFDLEFYENYSIDDRNAYFESQSAELKIMDYYEARYKRIYYFFYFFVLYAVFTVLAFMLNNPTPWKFITNRSINESLIAPSDNFPSTFYSSADQEAIRTYLIKGFFNENFRSVDQTVVYKDVNKLIDNKVILTGRKAKPNAEFDTDFHIRTRTSSGPDTEFSYENEDLSLSFSGENKIYFDTNRSYLKKGGLIREIDIANMNKNLVEIEKDLTLLLDKFNTSMTVEFSLFNLESKYFILFTFGIEFEYGGRLKRYNKAEYIPSGFFASDYESGSFLVLIVQILFLLSFTVYVIRSIIQTNHAYSKWYSEKIVNLSEETKGFRQSLNPEMIRRLTTIFNIDMLNNFMIIGFNLAAAIFILMFKAGGAKLNDKYASTDAFLFRNEMYEVIGYSRSATIFSGLTLIIMGVKFFRAFNLNKYYLLLIKTGSHSLNNNFVFIIFILMLQPAFIMFSHIGFGALNDDFNSFFNAFISCTKIMFNFIEFFKYYNANTTLGLIFYYVYLFIINVFLLNVFVSIIDRSYVKTVVDIRKINEKYELKRILFPCCYKKRVVKATGDNNTKFKYLQERNYLLRLPINLDTKVFRDKNWVEDQIAYFTAVSVELNELHYFRQTIENAWAKRSEGRVEDVKFEDDTNIGSFGETYYVMAKTHFLFTMNEFLHGIMQDIVQIERRYNFLFRYEDYSKTSNRTIAYKNANEEGYRVIMGLQKKMEELLLEHEEVRNKMESRNRAKEEKKTMRRQRQSSDKDGSSLND